MSIILNHNIERKITAHAEREYPFECCGFFFGENSVDRKIMHTREVNNAKEGDKRRRFEISGDDYREAEKFALDNDLDLLGVYHSHPDHPAEPSEHDRSVAMPYFSYIIVSVQDGDKKEIRSWQLNDERQFEEEAIELTEYSIPNKIIQ